ncbi:MAG: hypothetical protein OQK67_02950 [Chlorobium sp.]|nr:hypothetical protein [Chlorobium sp.]MCW8816145.1 hypothetical protein [Chlorobium sp.]
MNSRSCSPVPVSPVYEEGQDAAATAMHKGGVARRASPPLWVRLQKGERKKNDQERLR